MRAFDYAGRQVRNSLYASIRYDNGDRLLGMAPTSTNASPRSKAYGYDSLDRLTLADDGHQPLGYSYDANGNRLTDTLGNPSATPFPAPGAVNDYVTDPRSNRLLEIVDPITRGAIGFSYDANGSLLSYGPAQLHYDAAGRLTGAGPTQYVYNAAGQRVMKAGMPAGIPCICPRDAPDANDINGFQSMMRFNADCNNRLFAYDLAGEQVGEYYGRGQPVNETVYLGGIQMLVLSAGQTFYVQTDHLGSPRQIADGAGRTVWSWEIATQVTPISWRQLLGKCLGL